MYNRSTHHHPQGNGPTLQHPKPVPPPFALPSSPPIPDSQSFPAHPYAHHDPHSDQARLRSSSEYQRFSSPPAQTTAADMNQQHQTFYQPSGVGPSFISPANQFQHLPPHPQQQQQQHHHQQQQQQQHQHQNLWTSGLGTNPGAGFQNAFGVNDVTAQMGMQFGQSAMRAGSEYVEKNLTRYLPLNHLKHSFNVSNLYVFNKIKLILFPWRHKPWSRLVQRSEVSGQVEGYKPPREDINCPDAYIPVMAVTTYILLSGAVAGSKGRFDPELLSIAASQGSIFSGTKAKQEDLEILIYTLTALGILFFEFCCIKLGCYLLNVSGDGAVVDLVAYSGYKFVGIIISLLASLLGFRSSICWGVFIYVFLSNAFFLLRSLRYVILPDPSGQAFGSASTSTVSAGQKSRRIQFLFAIAVSQLASMWLLCRV